MNDDSDLKKMFDATRKVDEGLTPSFSDLYANSQGEHGTMPASSGGVSGSLPGWRMVSAIGASVGALLLVIGLAIWVGTKRPDRPEVASVSRSNLLKLNQVCDSILIRVSEQHSGSESQAGELARDMEWQTETDLLLPSETLSFNVRNSP